MHSVVTVSGITHMLIEEEMYSNPILSDLWSTVSYEIEISYIHNFHCSTDNQPASVAYQVSQTMN